MTADLAEQSLGERDMEEALAEVRDCRAELQGFFESLNANLKELAGRIERWESAGRDIAGTSEIDGLDERIQRLAELAEDFAESLDRLKNQTASPINSKR